ncbi:hypothetical protein U9M48_019903, partial [Paspalum notatum var. saurae]
LWYLLSSCAGSGVPLSLLDSPIPNGHTPQTLPPPAAGAFTSSRLFLPLHFLRCLILPWSLLSLPRRPRRVSCALVILCFCGKVEIIPIMMRGGRLMDLSCQALGMRFFSTEIFVSKLSFYTTEKELKDVFSPFGSVEEARLMRDRQTGRMKGFGFVKYSSQEEAEKAIKAMDGRIFRGRLIFVEMAKGHKSE